MENVVLLDLQLLRLLLLLALIITLLPFISEVLGLLLPCLLEVPADMAPQYQFLECIMTIHLGMFMDHMAFSPHFPLEAWVMVQVLLSVDMDLAFRDPHGLEEACQMALPLENVVEGQMVYLKGIGFAPNATMLTLLLEPLAT